MSTATATFGWAEIKPFFSAAGRQPIADKIAEWKREFGAEWLDHVAADVPLFYWLVDLAANHDAKTAIAAIVKEYPFATLIKPQLEEMHTWLKMEIDRPRC